MIGSALHLNNTYLASGLKEFLWPIYELGAHLTYIGHFHTMILH